MMSRSYFAAFRAKFDADVAALYKALDEHKAAIECVRKEHDPAIRASRDAQWIGDFGVARRPPEDVASAE